MKKKNGNLQRLQQNPNNTNQHTDRGRRMMKKSIRECGFGDSLTVDKHGVVISGNQRAETMSNLALSDAIVVQSDGSKPIIHQRIDLDLKKDSKAKKLEIYSNRVGETNLSWDADVLQELDIDLTDFWDEKELEKILGDDNPLSNDKELTMSNDLQFRVIVECDSEDKQRELLARFEAEGLKCQALTS